MTPAVPPHNPPTPGPDVAVVGWWAPEWGSADGLEYDQLSHLVVILPAPGADGSLTLTPEVTAGLEVASVLTVSYDVTLLLGVVDDRAAWLGDDAARAALLGRLADEAGAWLAAGVAWRLPAASLEALVPSLSPSDLVSVPPVEMLSTAAVQGLAAAGALVVLDGHAARGPAADPGPASPLAPSALWGEGSLATWVEAWLAVGLPADHLVVELALHGWRCPAGPEVPGAATGPCELAPLAGLVEASPGGLPWGRDPYSVTAWGWDGTHQVWFDDAVTLPVKVEGVLAQGVGGVGFWGMGLDDHHIALWDAVDALTSDPFPTGTTGTTASTTPQADAGPAQAACPGEVVTLDATASTVPAGSALYATWIQVDGPTATLDDPTSLTPALTVPAAGRLVLRLTVSDGARFATDEVEVLGLEPPRCPTPNTGTTDEVVEVEPPPTGRCATGPSGGLSGALGALLVTWGTRRQRRRHATVTGGEVVSEGGRR